MNLGHHYIEGKLGFQSKWRKCDGLVVFCNCFIGWRFFLLAGWLKHRACCEWQILTSRPYFILFALPGAFVWVYNMSSGGASEKAAIAVTRGRNGTKCNKCSRGHPQPEYNENLMSKKNGPSGGKDSPAPKLRQPSPPFQHQHAWLAVLEDYFSPTPVLDDKTEWMHIQSNQANHLATHVKHLRYYHWPIFTLQQNISGRCWCIIDPLKNLVKALS